MTTRQKAYTIVFAFLAITTSALSFQDASGSQARIDSMLAEASNLATVTFENTKALKLYQEAEKIDPDNYEMLWSTSRCYVDIGEHLSATTDQERQAQLEHYEKALAYANRAVEAHPTFSQGYLRRAIANGRVALFKGVWESLDLVKAVKKDTEKAITLDPKDATAYYILGRTHATCLHTRRRECRRLLFEALMLPEL